MMGMFDSIDWGDPQAMAALGEMQGYGQAAMPSRLPVPFASVLGLGAQGAMQGARGAQEYKQNQAKAASDTMANLQALQMLNLRNMAFGRPSLKLSDLYGGKIPDENSTMFGDVAQGASSPTQQPPAGPEGVLNGAPGNMAGGPIGGMITLNGARARQAGMPQGASSLPMGATSTPSGGPMPQMTGGSAPMSPAGMPAGPDGIPTPPQGMSPVFAGMMAQALGLTGYQAQKFIADAMPEGPERQEAQLAAAHAAGIDPFTAMRPGGALAEYDPATGKHKLGLKMPVLPEGYTLDDNENAVAVPGALHGVANIAGIQQGAIGSREKDVKNFGNKLEFGDLGYGGGSGAGGAGIPGANEPTPMPAPSSSPKGSAAPTGLKTDAGTIIPDVSSQPPIPHDETSLKAAIPQWQKRSDEINSVVEPAQQAEERLAAIAEAFKRTEPGAFASQKGELAANLKALGIDPPKVLGDPAAVQMALHENAIKTLQSLKAATNRFTQMEFRTLSQQSEHPDLQPEANLQQLGEDIAAVRQQRLLANDWGTARYMGWRNPSDFETAWIKANPYAPVVKSVKDEIGPLKGMPGGPGSQFSHTALSADVQAKAAAIKQQYRAKAISADQAQQRLKALGFPN